MSAADTIAAAIKKARNFAGNAVDAAGSLVAPWAKDTGISEFIAGGPTLNTQAKASGPSYDQYAMSGGTVGNAPGVSGPNASPTGPAYNPPAPTNNGGGGGGGSAPANVDLKNHDVKPGDDWWWDAADGWKQNATDNNRALLEASLGVYNTKAQNLRNQIPGIQQQGELRQRGLDEGLGQFIDTSTREQNSRLGDIDLTAKETADTFTGAERKTRASAAGLARQLRNMFAASGTIDSTQYKDMNIDQSKEALQALGDIRNSGANKAAVFAKEGEDVKQFYSEKITQQRQQTALMKDQARAETDQAVQGIYADINLTDSQKIEAVAAANDRLDQKLTAIDQQKATWAQQAAKDAQDLAIKLAELKGKGSSSAYTAAKDDRAAITAADNVIQGIVAKLGAITPEAAATVFTQFGVDKDKADQMGRLYTSGTVKDENPFAT